MNVYTKIDGKLAKYFAETSNPIDAINEVKSLSEVKYCVLAVVK